MQEPVQRQAKSRKKLLILILAGCFSLILAATLIAFGAALWTMPKKHEPEVIVPEVKGQDYRRAEALLKEKGLSMRVRARRFIAGSPSDVILDQSPRGGESAPPGAIVSVVVSRPPREGESGGQSK